ncbi:rhamnan synthesis F family protein [Rhizobium leucaenae]|uniref:rhamnan synthesis F family protein n=1 Tax=Rhizobium leucaenae TaxID=29450 RepID=UPI0009EE682E|nr:rhamnan synthesis F family protein [Rhizobium leucaenae]MBB6305180.1 lipopolysaccharide biosynthesis protein [Rhizobium leucaenae]
MASSSAREDDDTDICRGPVPLTDENLPKIEFTIFVHVFYPEVWEEMRREITEAVREPFGLVITRPPFVAPVPLPDTPFLAFSEQIEVENRGRDILPFLKALRCPLLPATDIGLKLHTKRSPHRTDGADWRRFLCDSLLETDGQSGLAGHTLLTEEGRLGLIAPNAHLLPLDGRTSINDTAISIMLRTLYGAYPSTLVRLTRFAAGSMFWFRRSTLAPLLVPEIDALFAAERGQLDGTAAHALERLFVTIIEHQGFLAASMENASPILNAPPSSLTDAELADLIEDTRVGENPFSLPLRDFWRKSPRLLKLVHRIYARLPKGIIRMLHAVMRF